MLKIKVSGGTLEGSGNLCAGCRHASIRYGDSVTQQYVACSQMADPKWPVRKCSAFMSKDAPSLGEMKDVAWILRTDETRKQIGFIRADDWRKQNKQERLLPNIDEDY